MDDVREALVAAAERAGYSLGRLSRMIGRNDAYLQQFVKRGTPRRLPERERKILADFLSVSEGSLGGPIDTSVPVRRLDVAASAGPGALGQGLGGDDPLAAVERFPASLVERLSLRPDALSLIVARGDSMEPTIADGDDILVDAADRRVGKRPAIFVLRIDGALVVKRLHLAGGLIAVESDNPDATPIAPVPAAHADVIGRVVWLGRKLG